MNFAEARINLNKLLEERKETAAELTKLQDRLTDIGVAEEPPSKQRKCVDMDSTYVTSNCSKELDEEAGATGNSPSKMNRIQLVQRIERIKEEIECKNVQINELQQMVIEADQGKPKLSLKPVLALLY